MQLFINKKLHSLVNDLRSNDSNIINFIDELENQFKILEPKIKAFIPEKKRFERLKQNARFLLSRYPEPNSRPPLFGVPVGVKDIFHTSGFVTKAGSKLPPKILEGKEADCIAKLRKAGVLILGKTVTTEFAYFEPGPTRNPHNLDHTPGGSSSGSAAAVAAKMCPLALGTQTIGSIIRPASFCGVFGFKPSYDRISRNGIFPVSRSLDHVGFFMNNIGGAELVASILCNDWRLKKSVSKPMLGIPEGPYLKKASKEMQNHFYDICKHLIEDGFEVNNVNVMPDFDEICKRHNIIMAAEFAKVHSKWFAKFSDRYSQKTIDLIKRGQVISKESLTDALSGREKLKTKLIDAMDSYGIDLWISPSSTGPAPMGIESTGDPIMNLPWTHSGLPTINLPAGKSNNGLPLGMQVAARWYEDEFLISWGGTIDESLRSFA